MPTHSSAMKTETFDVIAAGGSKVTLMGGVVGAVLTFFISNFVGLIGVLVAILGFWVNLHYKRKADKRRELEFQHDLRMKDNADRRFEEWQRFRIQMARDGVHVPQITDFGALSHASGPWAEKDRKEDDDVG